MDREKNIFLTLNNSDSGKGEREVRLELVNIIISIAIIKSNPMRI